MYIRTLRELSLHRLPTII